MNVLVNVNVNLAAIAKNAEQRKLFVRMHFLLDYWKSLPDLINSTLQKWRIQIQKYANILLIVPQWILLQVLHDVKI